MDQLDIAELELRTMRSAWRTLASRWDLTKIELATLLPDGGGDDRPPTRDTETRMRIMIEIGYRISLPDDLLAEWLRRPSPTLGWLTPLDAMAGSIADLRGVRRLVEMGFAS